MNPDRDKLAELANICAGHAAGTLAMLLDTVLLTQVPELRDLPAGRPLSALFPRDQRVAGIFADLRGVYPAKAALLLSAGAVEDVVQRVAGKEASEVASHRGPGRAGQHRGVGRRERARADARRDVAARPFRAPATRRRASSTCPS